MRRRTEVLVGGEEGWEMWMEKIDKGWSAGMDNGLKENAKALLCGLGRVPVAEDTDDLVKDGCDVVV